MSVNYASNSLCDERTYQPYVSVSYSGNSLCNEHMYVPALYGALVNYSGNCLYDEHAPGSICKLSSF